MTTLDELGQRAGVTWFDHQREAAAAWVADPATHPRHCLYFRTGAGKSLTALVLMALRGVHEVLVIAPPATHDRWISDGRLMGVQVSAISHAKFRQKGYLVRRTEALIVDEFHLLGGHAGLGWRKLDRLARGLQAPLLILSATPNYNDADRVYCIQHVCAPHTVKGGFIEFIYKNCSTEQNGFGVTPLVTGFLRFANAAEYLEALPYVHYLPDNVSVQVEEVEVTTEIPADLEEYGIDRRRERIVASQMEDRHVRMRHLYLEHSGVPRFEVEDMLTQLVGEATGPVLMFCNSSTIAKALFAHVGQGNGRIALLTGEDSTQQKLAEIERFRRGGVDVLIGTATLATGVDGLDKVCDTLIIVNDTDDDSLRRQLIGRILPRGADADASGKHVYRLVVSPS